MAKFVGLGGNDSNDGSSFAQRWLTPTHGCNNLADDEDLFIFDGTYTGRMSKTSPSTGNLITYAENERGVIIDSLGDAAIYLLQQDGVTVNGIVGRGADSLSYLTPPDLVVAIQSTNCHFHRVIGTTTNRHANQNCINLQDSQSCSVTQSEALLYHRHGITESGNGVAPGNRNNLFQLNFANGKTYADLTRPSGFNGTGDTGFSSYPGYNGRWWNNITKNNGHGFDVEPAYWSAQPPEGSINLFFGGNIAINPQYGFFSQGRGTTIFHMFRESDIENHLVYGPNVLGMYIRTMRNVDARNISVILDKNMSSWGFLTDRSNDGAGTDHGVLPMNINLTNYNFDARGFTAPGAMGFISPTTGVLSHANIDTGFVYSPSSGHTAALIGNPSMDEINLYIRSASPLYDAGLGGFFVSGASADHKGAECLRLYGEGNLLTNGEWFDELTGKVKAELRGAVVSGINDDPNEDLAWIETSLTPNAAKRTIWPSWYGSSGGGGSPPETEVFQTNFTGPNDSILPAPFAIIRGTGYKTASNVAVSIDQGSSGMCYGVVYNKDQKVFAQPGPNNASNFRLIANLQDINNYLSAHVELNVDPSSPDQGSIWTHDGTSWAQQGSSFNLPHQLATRPIYRIDHNSTGHWIDIYSNEQYVTRISFTLAEAEQDGYGGFYNSTSSQDADLSFFRTELYTLSAPVGPVGVVGSGAGFASAFPF